MNEIKKDNNKNNIVRKKPCPNCGSREHFTKDCPNIDKLFSNYFKLRPYFINGKLKAGILEWDNNTKYIYHIKQIQKNEYNMFSNLLTNENYNKFKIYLNETGDKIIMRYGKFNNETYNFDVSSVNEHG